MAQRGGPFDDTIDLRASIRPQASALSAEAKRLKEALDNVIMIRGPQSLIDALRHELTRVLQADQLRLAEDAFLFGASAFDFAKQQRIDPQDFFSSTTTQEPKPRSIAMPSEELPKEKLLLKLLNMTTSPNDGEALTALRKANELLKSAGWTWQMLLDAKIKIIPNPFIGLGNPAENHVSPPKPQPQARPSPPPPKPPKHIYPVPVNAIRVNRFADHCYCCGTFLDVNCGFIFNPSNHNDRAQDKTAVICDLCNQRTDPIPDRAALPRTKPKPMPFPKHGTTAPQKPSFRTRRGRLSSTFVIPDVDDL